MVLDVILESASDPESDENGGTALPPPAAAAPAAAASPPAAEDGIWNPSGGGWYGGCPPRSTRNCWLVASMPLVEAVSEG